MVHLLEHQSLLKDPTVRQRPSHRRQSLCAEIATRTSTEAQTLRQKALIQPLKLNPLAMWNLSMFRCVPPERAGGLGRNVFVQVDVPRIQTIRGSLTEINIVSFGFAHKGPRKAQPCFQLQLFLCICTFLYLPLRKDCIFLISFLFPLN